MNVRSNLANSVSKCNIRAPKTSGSIKMQGVCPSRITAHFDHSSSVVLVQFIAIHVVHHNDLRCQPLTTKETTYLVEQIRTGVTHEKIIETVKNLELSSCTRFNLLTMKDIPHIAEKIIYLVNEVRKILLCIRT